MSKPHNQEAAPGTREGRSIVRPEMVPVMTAGAYFAVGAAWIWFSGQAARALFPTLDQMAWFEVAKGWAFVLCTALALYCWLKWSQREHASLSRKLEEGIDQRTKELVAANGALESFTYSVAHDLRAPVAHVASFAQALEEAIARGDSVKAQHYTARIVANSTMMAGMIEGMLHVSRADRAMLHCERVDMFALVEEVIEELTPASDVDVRIEGLPHASVDRALMRQVWSNLISNAIKYSAHAESPCVHVHAKSGPREIVFSVQDNGVGFDPAESLRLFSAFQRLSNARDFAGSGVGLAIVKRVVERHGGRVWARGEPGQGAQFFFALPA